MEAEREREINREPARDNRRGKRMWNGDVADGPLL